MVGRERDEKGAGPRSAGRGFIRAPATEQALKPPRDTQAGDGDWGVLSPPGQPIAWVGRLSSSWT